MPTLNKCLERSADGSTGGLRILDRKGQATWLPWSEIFSRAREVAGGLQAAGVDPGDRVALVYPTGSGFFDAFFGALLAGAVPVPLYPPVRIGRLDEYHGRTGGMLTAAGAALVLADGPVKRLLGVSVAAAAPPLGCRTLDRLPGGTWTPAPVEGEDLGLIQFSSGTNREPKPVALTHRAILAQANTLDRLWPETQVTGVSWLPLYHDMGLIGCVMPALVRPAVLTLIPPERFIARPAVWLQTISRYQATISPAPNFAYGLCVKKIRDHEMEGVDLSSWKVALNGAETVVPSTLRAFRKRFARWGFQRRSMTPVYGMSEAALAVTFSSLNAPPRVKRFSRTALARERRAIPEEDGVELASVGTALPGFDLRILDPEGKRLPDGKIGVVHVRGPSLMSGYFGMKDATDQVLKDGWLDTGDLGFLQGGELFLTGRAKDMLLLRGRNHAPEEVEQAVEAVQGVRTGCAVAVSWLPEGAERETLLLLAETVQGLSAAETEAIPAACREAVLEAAGLNLDEVVLLPPGALPRTSSGKRRRQEALRRYRAGELDPPDRVTLFKVAGAMARSAWAFARSR